MKTRIIIISFVLLITTSICMGHRYDLKFYIYNMTGVCEGYYHNDNPIYTLFSDEDELYFLLSILNRTDTAFELGDWAENLKKAKITRWELIKGKVDPIRAARGRWLEDEGILLEEVNIKCYLTIEGLILRLPYQPYLGSLPESNKAAKIPEIIEAKSEIELLLMLKTEKPLPFGDYYVGFPAVVGGKEYICSGSGFRIRKVENKSDIAKLQKQKSKVFHYFGDRNEELKMLEESLKLVPNSPWTWYFLGEYFEGKTDYQTALEYYAEGQRRFPSKQEKLEKAQGFMGPKREWGTEQILNEFYFEKLIEQVEKRLESIKKDR